MHNCSEKVDLGRRIFRPNVLKKIACYVECGVHITH